MARPSGTLNWAHILLLWFPLSIMGDLYGEEVEAYIQDGTIITTGLAFFMAIRRICLIQGVGRRQNVGRYAEES